MTMRNAERWVREFDVFSKVDPTAPRVKTVSSGIVSILCFLLLGYLFVQEVREYYTVEVISEVSVDTAMRREIDSLNVSLLVEFPNLACEDFGLDAMDHMGTYLQDASGPDGTVFKLPYRNTKTKTRTANGYEETEEKKAGCILSGYLPIRMLRGVFQIGSRRESDFVMHQLINLGFGHDHGHEHVTPERTPFNVTHRIRAFSFGLVLPEAERPLEGVQATMAEGENNQYTYYVQVVPVIRQYASGERVKSYRYAFTSHVESRLNALPSVAWKYDFSAYEMTHREVPKSFAHFITRCCAVIGGAFVVFGLLSVAASHFENAAKKGK